MPRNVIILGSTGSIGTQTLSVLKEQPQWGTVIGLAARQQVTKLLKQAQEFKVKNLAIHSRDEVTSGEIDSSLFAQYKFFYGPEGLEKLATLAEADLVVSAVMGSTGIAATMAALKAGKIVALANKETLVAAGKIVMKFAQLGKNLLPIDSEHGGLFQCLQGHNIENIAKLWITASGGPFRDWDKENLRKVTPAQALKHPNWQMGGKITIDSATLMNKGLEVIEAHWLFGVPYDRIGVLVHPESIIHSMIEFTDGSVIAQLALPDMRLPIQYALSYPERGERIIAPLDLTQIGKLNFRKPEEDIFPCLRLAREAGICGGTMTTVLNAANEIAVEGFLANKISFLQIAEVVEDTMNKHHHISDPSLEDIYQVDAWARIVARKKIEVK